VVRRRGHRRLEGGQGHGLQRTHAPKTSADRRER
jgi:hypothetical protein